MSTVIIVVCVFLNKLKIITLLNVIQNYIISCMIIFEFKIVPYIRLDTYSFNTMFLFYS